MPAEDVPAHAPDRLAGRAGRRRDRLVRSLDATGSLAVVGTLLATGVVAGAMQSAAATPPTATRCSWLVAQPSEPLAAPAPRPTVTVYKTVLVTPSPRPVQVAAGGTSSTQTSSGGSSGSTWKPKKAAAPVKPAPKPPAPQPKPKPSASSSGS